ALAWPVRLLSGEHAAQEPRAGKRRPMTPMTRIEVGEFLAAAAARMQAPDPAPDGALRCGIDLGTATVVLTVVDGRDQPVYLDQVQAEAVRDGVVVDFAGAAT